MMASKTVKFVSKITSFTYTMIVIVPDEPYRR